VNRIIVRSVVCFTFLLTLASCANVAVDATSDTPDSAKTKLDPSVLDNTLLNGFQYYLRSANGVSDDSPVDIRLVVKVGSLQETNTQRGYAHLLEHLVLRGTQSFSAAEIEQFLNELGLRWGEDVNATTHYNATIYRFTLHQNDTKSIGRVLDLFSEFLHAVKFDERALALEKDIVHAEWRDRYGTRSYVVDPISEVAYAGSIYAGRPPIGDLQAITNASTSGLKAFWQQHYRPDNAALVITGLREPWKLEATIRQKFSKLESDTATPADTLSAYVNSRPVNKGFKFLSFQDRELESPALTLNILSDEPTSQGQERIAERFKGRLVQGVFSSLTRSRLRRTRFCSDLSSRTSILESGKTVEQLRVSITPDDYRECFHALRNAVDAVTKSTLTEEEYEDILWFFRRMVDTEVENYRYRSAQYLADNLVDHVVSVQVLLEQVVHSVERDWLNAQLKNMSSSTSIIYALVGSDEPAPAVRVMQGWAEEKSYLVQSSKPSNKKTRKKKDTKKWKPGSEVTPRKVYESDGYHQWKLSNGANVVLVQTEAEDKIAVAAYAHGGYAGKSKTVRFLPEFIHRQRLLKYSASETKGVYLKPVVRPFYHGLEATASEENISQLVSMISEYYFPKLSESYVIDPEIKSVARRFNQSGLVDDFSVFEIARRSLVPGTGAVTVAKLQAAQEALFGSMENVTVVFSGAVSADTIETELGKLRAPSRPSTRRLSANKLSFHNALLVNGDDSSSQLTLFFTCPADHGVAFADMQLFGDIVTERLRHALREQRGLTYGVSNRIYGIDTDKTVGAEQHLLSYRFSVDNEGVAGSEQTIKQVLSDMALPNAMQKDLQYAVARDSRDLTMRADDNLSTAVEMALNILAEGFQPNGGGGEKTTLQALTRALECVSASPFRTHQMPKQ